MCVCVFIIFLTIVIALFMITTNGLNFMESITLPPALTLSLSISLSFSFVPCHVSVSNGCCSCFFFFVISTFLCFVLVVLSLQLLLKRYSCLRIVFWLLTVVSLYFITFHLISAIIALFIQFLLRLSFYYWLFSLKYCFSSYFSFQLLLLL